MTNQDKEAFCAFMASLLSPPDELMLGTIHQGEVAFFLEDYIQAWGGSPELLSEFSPKCSPQIFLTTLLNEYRRLFSALSGEKISLVESTYKPWTSDAQCALPFAGEKGLLRGDSALHLSAIFRQLSLEIPEEYRGTPDHLVIELEFLSSLYQVATDEQIQGFIEDHLDWIPDLKEEFIRLHAHPFYENAIEILDLFLKSEKKRQKAKNHGSKKIH